MELQSVLRHAEKHRKSAETQITLSVNLDGEGKSRIKTGFGMLDHLLVLLSFWSGIDIEIDCNGDLEVDAHHTVEDTGLMLGSAFLEALGDRIGIARTGFAKVPMDEAMAEAAIDLSGRPWLEWRGDDLLPPVIAGEEKDVWREFFKSFAAGGRLNLHITFLYGKNGHHLLESAIKGMGLALKNAIRIESSRVSSSKGGLD